MLTSWVYNELAEDITATDTILRFKFDSPSSPSSNLRFKIDDELMSSDDWVNSAGLVYNYVNSTVRGVDSTTTSHKAGTSVWVENTMEINPSNVKDTSVTYCATPTGGTVNTIVEYTKGRTVIGGNFTSTGNGGYPGPSNSNRGISILAQRSIPIGSFVDKGGTSVGGTITTILVLDDGNLLVGGTFTTLSGDTCQSLGILDSYSGNLIKDFNLYVSAEVESAYIEDGYLYVTGYRLYDSTFGPTFNDITLVKYDINDNYKYVPMEYDLVHVGSARVNDVALVGNIAYLVGDFTAITDTTSQVTRNYCVAIRSDIDIPNHEIPPAGMLDKWDPNTNGIVRKIKHHEGYLYICGDFTTVGGVAINGFAKVDYEGKLDPTFTHSNGTGVRDFEIFEDERTGTTMVVLAGIFTTPQNRVALYTLDDMVLQSWDPNPNASVTAVTVINNRIHIGGFFTELNFVSRIGLSVHTNELVSSAIGKVKLEWVEKEDPNNKIESVRFGVYESPLGQSHLPTMLHDELVTSSSITNKGVRFNSSSLLLTVADEEYIVELNIQRSTSTSTTYYVVDSGVSREVVLVTDGSTQGHLYTSSDAFVAPTVAKISNTYNVTPTLSATGAVAQEASMFFRVWSILDIFGFSNAMDIREVVHITTTNIITISTEDELYFSERIQVLDTGSFDLIYDVKDTGSNVLISSGPHSLSLPIATTVSDADQVQVEYEYTDGIWGSSTILDWVAIPAGGIVSLYNLGPSAHTFRFRSRLRTFRRDGIVDKTGRPIIVSSWSAWSSYV